MIIGLPVPNDTTSLSQKVASIEVKLQTWDYSTVVQIFHLGAYNQEDATVEHLHKFIGEDGYEIAGPHEEEYLSHPDANLAKTIIRYPVNKK